MKIQHSAPKLDSHFSETKVGHSIYRLVWFQYSAQILEKDNHPQFEVLAANYTKDTTIQEQLLFEVNPYFQVRVHMKKCTSNKFNFLSEFVQLLVSTQEAHYRGSSGWC